MKKGIRTAMLICIAAMLLLTGGCGKKAPAKTEAQTDEVYPCNLLRRKNNKIIVVLSHNYKIQKEKSMNVKIHNSLPEAHYTVYRLTDPEGKVYIGCTGTRVKKRWQRGEGYKDTYFFNAAIQRYGWENIRKDILCEKLTKEGGEKLEEWFVNYYDSMNPDKGYNRMTGGKRKGAKFSAESIEQNRQSVLAYLEGNPESSRLNSEKRKAYYRNQIHYPCRIYSTGT